jgi:hypothetical protein
MLLSFPRAATAIKFRVVGAGHARDEDTTTL